MYKNFQNVLLGYLRTQRVTLWTLYVLCCTNYMPLLLGMQLFGLQMNSQCSCDNHCDTCLRILKPKLWNNGLN